MPLPRLSLRLACLCLLLAFAAAASAQQGEPPVGTPLQNLPGLPGNPGPLPANVSGNPAPAAELPTAGPVSFPSAPVADVLHYYETLSGKHVIYDTTVQGSVNLVVNNKVTRTELIHLIETALNLNGFVLIPTDGNVVKVIGISKNPRDFGVIIYYDLADVPDTDQIVTFLVRLHYLEPQETSGMLQQYIPVINTIAFTPLAKAGALLITDTGHSVRRLVKLISEIDQPAAPVTEKFFSLQRADATKAVEFLNNLFETKVTASTAANPGIAALPGITNARRPIRRIGDEPAPVEAVVGPNGALSLSGDSLIYGKLTLTPDVRTNRVYVVTSPVNLPVIESLLKEYDAGTPFAKPVRFPLKFLRPDLILPILVQSLQEGTDANGNGTTPGATNPNKNGQSNANNNNGNNNNNSAFGGLSSGLSGGLGGSGSGGLGGLGSSFGSLGSGSTQEIDTTPQEQVVGSTRLIADIANSSIIVLGGADAQDKVRAILLQLDRRSPQVLIHTVIGELSLGNNAELGFQYLLRTKQVGLTNNANLFTSTSPTSVTSTGTTSTTGSTSTTAPTTASTLSTLSSLASGLGSTFSGVGGVVAVGKSLDIILSALDSTNRFKTISRPMIVTSNFKRASITSGQTISVSTGSESSLTTTTANNSNLFQTTTQELAALQLTVTPQINSDKEVVMEVDQQLNSPIATTTTNGTANQQLNVRQLHNYVSARNGETIVLGGLITQDDNVTDSGIPYLARIPVIGSLFKSHTRDATRSELIILMQPEVVDTAGVMSDLRTRETDKTYLGPGLDNQLDPITVKRAYPVKAPRVKGITVAPTGK